MHAPRPAPQPFSMGRRPTRFCAPRVISLSISLSISLLLAASPAGAAVRRVLPSYRVSVRLSASARRSEGEAHDWRGEQPERERDEAGEQQVHRLRHPQHHAEAGGHPRRHLVAE